MAVSFGNNNISDIFHGNDRIVEVYHGNNLVYKYKSPIPASEDWEYTVESDNSAILTKYIGTNPVVIGPDYVKGDL